VRVVLLIVDGLPARHVGASVTPCLAALGTEGAFAVGRSVMTSATYPNHATFATGTDPIGHRILANWLWTERGPKPAQQVGPAVPTIFDACRSGGRTSVAVVGDHHLVPVMGAARADEHWPPDGVLADEVVRDAHGYAADEEVLTRLLPLLERRDVDLVVAHLNEPDTFGHVHGPDSEAAHDGYRATDRRVGVIIDALRPAWEDTVVLVVSDHDQETAGPQDPIDLYAPAEAVGGRLACIPEGNGAVVWGHDPTSGAWLDEVDGIAGHAEAWPGARVVWAEPHRWFALPPGFDLGGPEPGQHGGSTTRAQVAVAAGGHPAAREIAASIGSRSPEAADWALTIAALLDLDLPDATGVSLCS
jgi:arylsulfatase A-like enzyme